MQILNRIKVFAFQGFMFLLFFLVNGFAIGQPQIQSVSPTKGTTGDTVIIFGTNFPLKTANDSAKIQVGGKPASILTNSNSSATFIVPSGATNGTIILTATSNGQAAKFQGFRYAVECPGAIDLGSLAIPVIMSALPSISNAITLDWDLDGDLDIIGYQNNSTQLSVFQNNSIKGVISDSSFTLHSFLNTTSPIKKASSYDLNGNGEEELIVVQHSQLTIFWGGSSNPEIISLATPSKAIDIVITDWNNNGRPDIILTDSSNQQIIAIQNNCFSPFFDQFQFGPNTIIYFPVLCPVASIIAVDLDLDLAEELLLSKTGTDSIQIINQGPPGGNLASSMFVTDTIIALAGNLLLPPEVSDINIDGAKDILIYSSSTSGSSELRVYLNNGVPGIIDYVDTLIQSGVQIEQLFTRDMNMDGTEELLEISNPFGSGLVNLIDNQSIGTAFSPSFSTPFVFGLPAIMVETIFIDIDQDGIQDLFHISGSGTLFAQKNLTRPLLRFEGLPLETCILDTALELFPKPIGGLLSGPGTNGISFLNPANVPYLPTSFYTPISYTFTNSKGCSRTLQDSVLIKETLFTSFGILDTSINSFTDTIFCFEDKSFYELVSLDPNISGTFSGNGVFGGSSFSVDSISSLDKNDKLDTQHEILFITSSPKSGCKGKISREITVKSVIIPLQIATDQNFPSNAEICLSDTNSYLFSGWVNDGFTGELSGLGLGNDTIINNLITSSFSVKNITSPDSIVGTTFSIIFTLEDSLGCVGTRDKALKIINSPSFSLFPDLACSGGTTSFSAKADSASEAISGWIWTLPDETNFNGNPLIVADLDSGLYPLSVTAIGENDCETTVEQPVVILEQPHADFTVFDDCLNSTLRVQNLSAGSIDSYHWNTTEGIPDSSEAPTIIFSQSGVQQISLIVANEVCADTLQQFVNIYPVVSSISSFAPYSELFDTSSGGWISSAGSSWEWGNTTGPTIIPSDSGNIWKTGLATTYLSEESSWIASPCLDISSLQRPMLSLDKWTDLERDISGQDPTGVVIQVRTIGDTTYSWLPLGQLIQGKSEGINWYNSSSISSEPGGQKSPSSGWTGQDTGWTNVRHRLDQFSRDSLIQIRLAFSSDIVNSNRDGIGLDNVFIGERKKVQILEYFLNESDLSFSSNNLSLNKLTQPLQDEIFLLQYHTAFPSPDPINLLNPDDQNARSIFYAVGIPQIVVLDGNEYIGQIESLDSLFILKNTLLDPLFNMTISPKILPNGSISISTSATSLSSLFDKELIILTGVANRRRILEPGNELIRHELIEFLPDASGSYFYQDWKPGTNTSTTHVWSNSSGLNSDSVVFFSFIQNVNTKEVYQVIAASLDKLITNLDAPLVNKDFKIFPNPTSGSLQVNASGSEVYIMNSLGQIVHKQRIQSGEINTLILNHLPKGVYSVILVDKSQIVSSKRLILQ